MSFTAPSNFSTRPTLQGTFGMSASTHWLATATAQSVLERGGNAFDAATAAAFVLHVVEPHLNGPGGDLVGIFATAEDPTPQVLMGQGPAPAAASREHYLAEGLELVPGSGALAAAVPGAVDAWLLLLRDHGSWSLPEILDYAIDYARNGHPVAVGVCRTIETVQQLFIEHWPTSAEQWLPDGKVPQPGELIRNEAWARTLQQLTAAASENEREAGIDTARMLWRSEIGRAVAEFAAQPHRHSSGSDHAGVITAADFQAFEASYEKAVSIEFRGHTIAKAGPWSQGPALLQTLRILDGFEAVEIDPSTAGGAHNILEAQKLAYADREAYYGDSDNIPIEELISANYADQRRTLITETASEEFRPGQLEGLTPFTPPLRVEYASSGMGDTSSGVGEPTVRPTGETRGDTCHLDVIDRWGNIISATPSGGWLQSSPYIPEVGFCLGTRLQMNWLEADSPATLTPGKRPRTTLTPTLVLKDGKPITALGSPGGDQQDQWQLLYLLRTLVGGYQPQQAIDAPALHTTSIPGSFWPRTWEPAGAVLEDRLGTEVIEELERRGHRINRSGGWSLGRLSAVGINPDTGVFYAAANPRGMQGYASGR
ncbi:gamma-glutamyltranspeptidase/glutathione hydrolase [Psychromicrobium silvestre]|uniref:Gamma-glutamyltranspeptidase/glutathione hydrolase n=1 Tax=Psychromicrobium silvestre TaxID=1645614 RepID=A0A7Y9LUN1_9MICC|nr:gamma-glutamyltransferase [Psychromicrobium silvestre]NYE95850.1 gamma-glutamyltranspeptidase/glutathione hydrolase [Psychromicrobium silvestre]